jgi:prepilin-type N-terminal cleavage/methylation domain-containing protein
MIYIHKLAQGLSSNLAPASDFPFRSLPGTNTVGANATRSMTKNSYPAHAFTFIELLVVIVVLGILFTIAYPVFIGTQERAKITKDMSNLRQIGLAAQTYMNDNDGVFPGSTTATWMSQLELYSHLSTHAPHRKPVRQHQYRRSATASMPRFTRAASQYPLTESPNQRVSYCSRRRRTIPLPSHFKAPPPPPPRPLKA